MNMINISSHYYGLTIQRIADASQIIVKLGFHWWEYQRLAVLGAEHDVVIMVDKWLAIVG